MGKFYEMFEMDAHIGAKDLDLQYMKVCICESGCFFWWYVEIGLNHCTWVFNMLFVQGEQPHCGFPEKNFSDNAEKLARKVHDGFVTL